MWQFKKQHLIYFNDSLILPNSDQKEIMTEIIYQISHINRCEFLFCIHSRQKDSDDSNNLRRINHFKMLWKSQV